MADDDDDGGTVGAITKLFPDLSYDLIARLPAGVLAVILGFWISGAAWRDLSWLGSLSWPPAVALLLLLFPFLHTVGVVVSAVSWTLVAWWLRPAVYWYLLKIKAGAKDQHWRKANKLEIAAFRAARLKKDAFAPILTKSRAEMALATNLLATYVVMTGVGMYAGSQGWFTRAWVSLGVLLFVATVSRTRSYFGWLFT